MSILAALTSIADLADIGGLSSNTTAGNKYTNVLENIGMGGANTEGYFQAPDMTEFWMSFYVIYTGTNETTLIQFNDGAVPAFRIQIANTSGNSAFKLQYWTGSAWSDVNSFTGTTSRSVLHRIDMHVKLADSGGIFDVWYDGVSIFTFSGDTLVTTGVTAIDRIVFPPQGSSVNANWSACIVADEDTRAMYLSQQVPTGNSGTNTGWAGGFGNIDETGINDTDQVVPSALNDISTYSKTTVAAALNTGYTVAAVVLALRGQNSDPSQFKIKGAFRISSTNYGVADFGFTDKGIKGKQIVLAQNPATSAAWTYAAINGAEIGMKLVAA